MTQNIIKVEIPSFSYKTALSLAENRSAHFTNQFITKKLKEKVKDNPILERNIEGVIGYIGDMCASIWFGEDPKENMRNMIIDTGLLTHRDEYDLIFRGNKLDIKTEFYPDEKFERAVKRELKSNETYGCRLINEKQFNENSRNIDIYLFATNDKIDPRKAEYWYAVGWITKDKAKKIAPKPTIYTPAGGKLFTPAYCIPNEALEDPFLLKNIDIGSSKEYKNYKLNPKYKFIDKSRLEELLTSAGL